LPNDLLAFIRILRLAAQTKISAAARKKPFLAAKLRWAKSEESRQERTLVADSSPALQQV
jgi:hypothetical protein